MGKVLKIMDADFSSVSICNLAILSITIDASGNVTIDDEIATAIYYTIDGTTPSEKSNKYTESFTVEDGTTVNAISAYEDGSVSNVVSKIYTSEITNILQSEVNELGYQIGTSAIVKETVIKGIGIVVNTENDRISLIPFNISSLTGSKTKIKFTLNSGIKIALVTANSDKSAIFYNSSGGIASSFGWTTATSFSINTENAIYLGFNIGKTDDSKFTDNILSNYLSIKLELMLFRFDTDLNKMLICTDPANKTWKDMSGNAV